MDRELTAKRVLVLIEGHRPTYSDALRWLVDVVAKERSTGVFAMFAAETGFLYTQDRLKGTWVAQLRLRNPPELRTRAENAFTQIAYGPTAQAAWDKLRDACASYLKWHARA